ncbi:NUDIX domain-containing protein [Corynebacterium choanae]|uniref:8-oxo-dGTP diphosphatase n=1 Tax=Corynebacterium choanae TaxID=1862358 RepID=A0A3G6J635_9CORY|nr:bifunctional NUDIX hydrolase/histidine phosphatase family protein [Corynebacterium choanae]AZA13406.1 8-oxo-dGTP diphosphatase [Corynebacterium choanae]
MGTQQSGPHHAVAAAAASSLAGRLQMIGPHPAREGNRRVIAAGAVVYRTSDNGTVEYAMIHRPRYDDWSLAKGKLDPGESIPATAAREILEETGYTVRLGKLLGLITYPVGSREKAVYYFTAEVTGGDFVANDEVDTIAWLPLEQAIARATYEVDALVLTKAAKRLALPEQTRLIVVRHAHAFARHNWAGDDNKRPLDKKGVKQAEALVAMLTPFGPTAVYSAAPDRCQDTAAPLAEALGVPVTVDTSYGDEGWTTDPKGSLAKFIALETTDGIPVVVSQGLTIPEYLASASVRGSLPIPDEELVCKKGSAWLLTFSQGRLCGADYLASALPVK